MMETLLWEPPIGDKSPRGRHDFLPDWQMVDEFVRWGEDSATRLSTQRWEQKLWSIEIFTLINAGTDPRIPTTTFGEPKQIHGLGEMHAHVYPNANVLVVKTRDI